MSQADDLYDYGPPTTVGDGSNQDDAGTPAETVGDEVDAEGGDSPQDNSDATTIVEPGGSPTDEVVEAYTPAVSSLTPATAETGTDLDVTVTGERFNTRTVATFNGADAPTAVRGDTELVVTLPLSTTAAGTYEVGVRTEGLVSNTSPFTVTDPVAPEE